MLMFYDLQSIVKEAWDKEPGKVVISRPENLLSNKLSNSGPSSGPVYFAES